MNRNDHNCCCITHRLMNYEVHFNHRYVFPQGAGIIEFYLKLSNVP